MYQFSVQKVRGQMSGLWLRDRSSRRTAT